MSVKIRERDRIERVFTALLQEEYRHRAATQIKAFYAHRIAEVIYMEKPKT